MHSKIYKAKLITIHSAQQGAKCGNRREGSQPIHAYFGMLQHIFHRNKHMIKELKLSGTKIQNNKRSQIRIPSQERKHLDLNSRRTKIQKDKAMQGQQLAREKSLPNCRCMISSVRNRSIQPWLDRQNAAKKDAHLNEEEMFYFMPLGQASQRNIVVSNRPMPENQAQEQNSTNQGHLIHNFTMNNFGKQTHSNRQHIYQPKKQSLKLNRRSCLVKTEPSEAKTNYSSIRTTQNSNKQVTSVPNLYISPHEVTPW